MAELSQSEQVEAVRKALTLETALAVERAEVQLVKGREFDWFPTYEETFPDKPPKKPQRTIVEKPAPVKAQIPEPPKADYGFAKHLKSKPIWIVSLCACIALYISDCIGVFGYPAPLASDLSVLALLAWCICFVRSASRERKRQNQDLANSPEYLQVVAQANQQAADLQAESELIAHRTQAKFDAQYEADLAHYTEVLLPAYRQTIADNRLEYEDMKDEYAQDKSEWEEKRDSALALLRQDIAENEAALEALYNSTRLISLHYRQIPLLEWIYDDMRSSNHDIRYATELLDRDRLRDKIEEAGARTSNAIDKLQEQAHSDALGIAQLQGVQIRGLLNLEAISSDILFTTEDIYASGKKVLFHQRVNTADKALREWRRHKAKKAAR